MQMDRRDFIRWVTASAAMLGLSQSDLLGIKTALASSTAPPVIWLQGAVCSGCSVAALNVVSPTTINDLVINKINLTFQPTLMAAGAAAAIEAMDKTARENSGNYILVVEGGVQAAAGGRYCIIGDRNGKPVTMLDAVSTLGPKAKRVLAVGTCAAFKGIPGAGSNPTGVTRVTDLLRGKTRFPVINLPGCPAPPENVFGVVANLLAGKSISLDSLNRPRQYYGTTNHLQCPRLGTPFASALGKSTCLMALGCQGPSTFNNCPNRKWNNRRNWCIGANHLCIGCASPNFPTTPLLRFGRYGTGVMGPGMGPGGMGQGAGMGSSAGMHMGGGSSNGSNYP